MKKRINQRTKKLALIAGITVSFIFLMILFLAPHFAVIAGTGLAIVPIWGYVKNATFKELTAEEIEKLEPSDQVKYFNELNLHREKKLENLRKDLEKQSSEQLKKQIAELKTEMNKANVEQMATLQKAMEEQGMALRSLMEKSGDTQQTLTDFLDSKKELIIKIAKGHSSEFITIKSDTLRANVNNSKIAYTVPDIGQLATRKLTIYDLFAKVPVGAASGGTIQYYDWDETTTVRAAAVIAEGGSFDNSTAKWKWYSLPLVKVGDILPVSDEFEKDMPRFYAELGQFLQTNVDLVVDTQLYSGDGTGSNMTGLFTAASTYTPVASGITDASIYDLIVIVRSSITAGKRSKYSPNFVLMNSTDINKYKLKKDANYNYVMPPFVSKDGKVIDNVLVVESAAVTANTMLLGDNRYAKIYEVDGYTLQKGYATGDFESDMMSLKARRRLMILVKNADKAGFKKVSSISAALTTLAS